MQRLLESEPDLVLVTGDLVTKTAHTPLLARMLAPLAARRTFVILGNHDYWAGPAEVAAAVRAVGLDVVGNGHRTWDTGAGRVVVSGCEDPWNPRPWQRPPTVPGDLLVVMSHTPDNIYRLAASDAALVFSGHNHGGQLRLPLFGSVVVPSIYGRRFDHGHFVVSGTHLFVTAGIGAVDPPIRLFCPPDVFVVDVHPGDAGRVEARSGRLPA